MQALTTIFKNRIWMFLPIFILFAGCSFSDLKKDLAEQESLITIKGLVATERVLSTSPIIIGLITDDPHQPALVNHRILDEPGDFSFLVPSGRYKIFAFEDANNDQHYQESEYVSKIVAVDALAPKTKVEVSLTVLDETVEGLQKQAADIKAKVKMEGHSKLVTPGTTAELDSPNFSQENVNMGLWQPLHFVKTVSFGLFFLKEYDSKKVPVLYVHGVSGSPVQFRELIEDLDHSKYQPFVFYYPSGFSISMIGQALNREIEEAQARYGFKELIVIAHSMGGLVTREFFNNFNQPGKACKIKTYITISTPWGGHQAASMGLKYAPAVIPVWKDVAPGSKFMNSFLTPPLPEETVHYLFFGYRGESHFAGGNSDGVVSIATQLRMEVQKKAILVRGFDETHTSILKSEKTLRSVKDILEL